MTLFKLLFIAILFVIAPNAYQIDQSSDCLLVYQQVRQDQNDEQLKYYYFGIAQLPPITTSKLKMLYQIKVISLGCMVNETQICYNQYVDMMLKAKTGKDFYGLVEGLK